MHFAADSREATVVVEDLMATGRIRFKYMKGMSPDGEFCSNQRSLDIR